MNGQKEVNGLVFLALGLFFISSGVVEGEIYALRPSPRIAAADPKHFGAACGHSSPWASYVLGGSSGYLWTNRSRS